MADQITLPQSYGFYQAEIYLRGMFQNTVPTVTTDPNALEAQAKAHMSARSYAYVAGGAGERATMDANRLAFRQWRLIPRMLRDTSVRDTSVLLFGVRHPSPLLLAPIGVLGIFHPDAEAGVARVAADLEVPYVMSTAAMATIEEVGEASGDGANRWYQLYWPRTDDITVSLLGRAKKAGFSVLVVTLDTFSLAWRPLDLDLGYLPFLKGIGSQVGLSDPVFRRIWKERSGKEVEEDVEGASLAWQMDAFSGKAPPWEKIKLLKDNWDGPIVLKGIQHVDDAKLAVEFGVDGIIVSNHGGRQLDGAIASLEVLGEIVDAVGDKLTVLFDSGVRTGVDVIKALCLGAKGVLIGRPVIYGLGIGGKEGAKQVIQGLLADMDQSMSLAGIKSIAECQRSLIRKVSYGESHSSN